LPEFLARAVARVHRLGNGLVWTAAVLDEAAFVNLLASAHRVPRFLIMWESGHGSAAAISPESGPNFDEVVFLHSDSLVRARPSFPNWDRTYRATRTGWVLPVHAGECVGPAAFRDVHARRGDVLAAHSAIPMSWLVASHLEHIAKFSEQWHQRIVDRSQPAAVKRPWSPPLIYLTHMQVSRGELAWRLVQTHRVGNAIPPCLREHVVTWPDFVEG